MAYIHAIYDFDIENDFGQGPTTTVFWNYCSFHCTGCWNIDTWDRKEDLYVDNDELVTRVIKALDLYGFDKQLSLLGGDPLIPQNIEDTLYFLKEIRKQKPNIKIGVWSGFKFDFLTKHPDKYPLQIEALNLIDVLIDGQFIIKRKVKNRRYGSWNQRVILTKKSLKLNKIVLEPKYASENGDKFITTNIDSNILFDKWLPINDSWLLSQKEIEQDMIDTMKTKESQS